MEKKNFIKDNFLLQNKYAVELYNKYAKEQPIIDFHNHLSPKEIAEDRVFENITQVWIAGGSTELCNHTFCNRYNNQKQIKCIRSFGTYC